ncbi:MAG: prolipoprotein diacylglyceryl transferase [Candidatus Izimaplasma sp.]|nr:prolipoprotein diacylglyceryl transferase [Candidatus Izimaplasma bacterium]
MHIYDPINNIFLDLGFITWYKYSFMIMSGIVVAFLLAIQEGKKLGIKTDDIIDGVLIIVPLSIVGTRLWYVIFEWERYAWDIVKIFSITDGGLAIHGGIFTAFISAYFYTKWKGINFLSTFDLMAPGFIIAQAFGRWGNFFNQEAHGGVIGGVMNGDAVLSLDKQRAFLSETLYLPDFITNNMYLYGPDGLNYYHPTFLYESVWNIVGFGIMLILRRLKFTRRGDLLAVYAIWYSIGRFFIEGMRTDSLYIGNTGLRTAQIISIIMILGGIGFLVFSRMVLKPKRYVEVLKEHKNA